MKGKEALQETAVMKYYIIYENITVNPEYRTARFVCIVEHKEVAEDFCKKNSRFYYEEVKIEK